MTKEQIIDRISKILNDTGAHIELEKLAMECGVTELDCETLSTNIEEEIAGQISWLKPTSKSRGPEERHWENMATHLERFCD